MNSINQLRSRLGTLGVERIYAKRLAANDNSKNQVYLGSNFEVLNLFPNLNIYSDPSQKNNILKSPLNFSWLSDDGFTTHKATHAQLIMYPQYPEVRLSGFLKGCENPPSSLMKARVVDRILFLGIKPSGDIIGYVVPPNHHIAAEAIGHQETDEIFIEIPVDRDSRAALITELKRIQNLGWIDSKRLDKDRNLIACRASNCGGYTLEAELGVIPNGDAKPDYLGWEVKQFSTNDIQDVRLGSKAITLMTPEPTGGFYRQQGVVAFVMKYGYADKNGRERRMNYGGIYYCDQPASATGHILSLSGYDASRGTFDSRSGGLMLKADSGRVLASWGFDSLLTHWNRKHAKAVYVPSIRRGPKDNYQFRYSSTVFLGEGTSFSRFLSAFQDGQVYYDPGIKVEDITGTKTSKRRSQFRVKARDLEVLYDKWEEIHLG